MAGRLLQAALTNDWVGVKRMIETENELSDINESLNKDGLTPIVLASIAEEWELVYTMVTKFQNVNVNAYQSIGPYIQGFRCPEEDHFVALHIDKLRTNAKYQHLEKTPLWYAVNAKQWFVAEALQQKGATLIYSGGLLQHWQEEGAGYVKTLREHRKWPTEFYEEGSGVSIDDQILQNKSRYVFLPPKEQTLVEPRVREPKKPKQVPKTVHEEMRLDLAALQSTADRVKREYGLRK